MARCRLDHCEGSWQECLVCSCPSTGTFRFVWNQLQCFVTPHIFFEKIAASSERQKSCWKDLLVLDTSVSLWQHCNFSCTFCWRWNTFDDKNCNSVGQIVSDVDRCPEDAKCPSSKDCPLLKMYMQGSAIRCSPVRCKIRWSVLVSCCGWNVGLFNESIEYYCTCRFCALLRIWFGSLHTTYLKNLPLVMDPQSQKHQDADLGHFVGYVFVTQFVKDQELWFGV